MDENKYLILVDKKDKTSDISSLNEYTSGIQIKYNGSEKVYLYKHKSRIVFKQNPTSICPKSCLIYLGDICFFNVEKILDFKTHVRVFFKGKNPQIYEKNKLKFDKNILFLGSYSKTINYLKELAENISNEKNDFLDKQYMKINHISANSVLAKYISSGKIEKMGIKKLKIFPFGLNLSQEDAVEKSLTNQISIIEGPPGTGKTQTILNIIANLVINNKTVAVVSNNNAAIENVFEKLDIHKLSFFTALLGNKDNKKAFLQNQEGIYPNFSVEQSSMSIKELEKSIVKIKNMLHSYNDLAKIKQELEALNVEKRYFMQMYEKREVKIDKDKSFTKYKLERILSLWSDIEYLKIRDKKINLFFKLKGLLKYRIFTFVLYSYSFEDIITFLQKIFYVIREKELNKKSLKLEKMLKKSSFEETLEQYTKMSMSLFKSHLSKKYNFGGKRKIFDKVDLWKKFSDFTKEYPVILSTTHALKSSGGENFIYDYLIIDEASQVDIVAGSLALSCAKNVVVVGDLKQLPHIVTNEVKEAVNNVFDKYSLQKGFDYNNNLLLSLSMIFPNIPKTLLKEHYRCHPKIIDFCNKKFYNNELIILTKSTKDKSPLVLFNTAMENHARGTYNQRQIDVIKNEILSKIDVANLGIISPYRKQVNKLVSEVTKEFDIEIDTVHKYQGRERDTIIISTVVDRENEFADNPNLLNVAISRAKNKLYVVVSDNEKNRNTKDLVKYIQYNNFDINESKIYSIFDLLYKNYAPFLKKHLDKLEKISTYKSENLMNIVINNVLDNEEFIHLDKIFNYPLNKIIKDTSILNLDEIKFVQHNSTHVDFLIYNTIYNQPVLVIEVDGVAFHENNPVQLKRDALKDRILEKYNLPIIRFATNGSEEEKKLMNKLKEVIGA